MRTRLAIAPRAVLVALLVGSATAQQDPSGPRTFHSNVLDTDLLVLPGVFWPAEAEFGILPFMAGWWFGKRRRRSEHRGPGGPSDPINGPFGSAGPGSIS